MKPLTAAHHRSIFEEIEAFDFDDREGPDAPDSATTQEKVQDADFFNKFEDDFDESDMKLE